MRFLPIIPVAVYRVNEPVAQVHLIVFKVRTRDIEDYFILMFPDAQMRAHLARVTAHTLGGELDAGRYVPAGGIVRVLEC